MKRAVFMWALWVSGPAYACDWVVESPWIRAAPPNATALAGYGRFVNAGDKPVRIQRIESDAFARSEAHESTVVAGIAKMRALTTVEIPARTAIEFAPGGRHLMLFGPKQPLGRDAAATIAFTDSSGCTVRASFAIADTAPEPRDHRHDK